jgi:hypothetical protein
MLCTTHAEHVVIPVADRLVFYNIECNVHLLTIFKKYVHCLWNSVEIEYSTLGLPLSKILWRPFLERLWRPCSNALKRHTYMYITPTLHTFYVIQYYTSSCSLRQFWSCNVYSCHVELTYISTAGWPEFCSCRVGKSLSFQKRTGWLGSAFLEAAKCQTCRRSRLSILRTTYKYMYITKVKLAISLAWPKRFPFSGSSELLNMRGTWPNLNYTMNCLLRRTPAINVADNCLETASICLHLGRTFWKDSQSTFWVRELNDVIYVTLTWWYMIRPNKKKSFSHFLAHVI